jgi:hypothetical protein
MMSAKQQLQLKNHRTQFAHLARHRQQQVSRQMVLIPITRRGELAQLIANTNERGSWWRSWCCSRRIG